VGHSGVSNTNAGCLGVVEQPTAWATANTPKVTLGRAEKGCSDMLRFFSQATGMTAEVEKEFLSKFRQLRERLDALKRLYGSRTSLVVQYDI